MFSGPVFGRPVPGLGMMMDRPFIGPMRLIIRFLKNLFCPRKY
jgi:hypothetical protein